jgi:hypothetical protein
MRATIETRRAAHEFVKPLKESRKSNILQAMGGDALTAREIAIKMGFGEDLNKVRPRLTELLNAGKITETGTKVCPVTQRCVAVFKVVEE